MSRNPAQAVYEQIVQADFFSLNHHHAKANSIWSSSNIAQQRSYRKKGIESSAMNDAGVVLLRGSTQTIIHTVSTNSFHRVLCVDWFWCTGIECRNVHQSHHRSASSSSKVVRSGWRRYQGQSCHHTSQNMSAWVICRQPIGFRHRWQQSQWRCPDKIPRDAQSLVANPCTYNEPEAEGITDRSLRRSGPPFGQMVRNPRGKDHWRSQGY